MKRAKALSNSGCRIEARAAIAWGKRVNVGAMKTVGRAQADGDAPV